jgi:hypothetical protein
MKKGAHGLAHVSIFLPEQGNENPSKSQRCRRCLSRAWETRPDRERQAEKSRHVLCEPHN